MAHGTEAQRQQWMPRILAGDDVWCQLFSEPDAGSDLAGLSTRAEQRGDVYVVTGQKVWSSYARFADWGIALVRTDPDAPPHKGISMVAIPMDAKGVDVRPLRQLTGDSEFSEVFLDGVEIPVEQRIGPEHEGWRVANTTLANERGASFIWKEQVLHEVAIERLSQTCADRGLLDDPIVRQRLTQSWIEVELFRLHNQRTLARLARGDEIGSESSLVKLFWAGLSQRLAETAIALLGPDALLLAGDDARGRRRTLGARAPVVAGQLDHGRHERDPAQHHRRAAARPAARAEAAMSAGVDALDLLDPARFARRGYPHDVWTRLRAEAPVAYFAPEGYEPFWAITKHADILRDLEAAAAASRASRGSCCAPPASCSRRRRWSSCSTLPGTDPCAGSRTSASRPERCGASATTSSGSPSRSSPRRPTTVRRASSTSSSGSRHRSRSRSSRGCSACRTTTGACCSAGPTR